MDSLKPHLCVPMGLVVDNTREFILESLDDTDETPLSVVSESMMDYMYGCMVIGPKIPSLNRSIRKTQRKQKK